MLKETSANVELETKMVEIYRTRDEANRVVGIRVATADGYKTIEAKKGVERELPFKAVYAKNLEAIQ